MTLFNQKSTRREKNVVIDALSQVVQKIFRFLHNYTDIMICVIRDALWVIKMAADKSGIAILLLFA